MSEDEAERTEGVDFSDVNPILEEISYPITVDELVEQYGDHEIERTNAETITIRELFEPMEDDTFESADGAQQTILTMMPKDSEGRQRYSDRGLTVDEPAETGEREDRPLPGHDTEDGDEDDEQ